jgi:hypothetical protein
MMSSALVVPRELSALMTGWQAAWQAPLRSVKSSTTAVPRFPGEELVTAMPAR